MTSRICRIDRDFRASDISISVVFLEEDVCTIYDPTNRERSVFSVCFKCSRSRREIYEISFRIVSSRSVVCDKIRSSISCPSISIISASCSICIEIRNSSIERSKPPIVRDVSWSRGIYYHIPCIRLKRYRWSRSESVDPTCRRIYDSASKWASCFDHIVTRRADSVYIRRQNSSSWSSLRNIDAPWWEISHVWSCEESVCSFTLSTIYRDCVGIVLCCVTYIRCAANCVSFISKSWYFNISCWLNVSNII